MNDSCAAVNRKAVKERHLSASQKAFEGQIHPDAPDGLLHRTIWKVVPGNCLKKGAGTLRKKKMLGKCLDEPSVIHMG